jgi:exonuclease III
VPSSDRAPDKVTRKREFIASLLDAVGRLPPTVRGSLILGGDYNVITRDHQPPYRGFLPFEYAMLDALQTHGLVDVHKHRSPGSQPHSWIGRTGNSYRFDYFHVGHTLAGRITDCAYLHQPREQKPTDHAAVTLTLDLPAVARLTVGQAGLTGADTLF